MKALFGITFLVFLEWSVLFLNHIVTPASMTQEPQELFVVMTFHKIPAYFSDFQVKATPLSLRLIFYYIRKYNVNPNIQCIGYVIAFP